MRDLSTSLTTHRNAAILLSGTACLAATFGVGYQLAATAHGANRIAPRYVGAQGPTRTTEGPLRLRHA
jgi:hypothetical protein